MTVGELYSLVAQLGFEEALENDERFYFSANRAMLQVNTIRPATKALLIDHNPPKNLIKSYSFKPITREKEITFEAEDAKAYYFEADGNGILYVERFNEEDGEWEFVTSIPLSSRKTFVKYSGFIKIGNEFVKGLIRLRFSGEYIYSIRNVALYGQLYSDDKEDIPTFEPYTRYDFKSLTDDFLAFSNPPILDDAEQTRLNQGYEVEEGSVLLLPYESSGVYKVNYKRRPRAIDMTEDAATSNEVIDLDEELCYAMPNLIASYVLAEDEPELSQYYLTLYRERVGEIRATDRNAAPAIYRNVNGW